jgi:hypothetical protein
MMIRPRSTSIIPTSTLIERTLNVKKVIAYIHNYIDNDDIDEEDQDTQRYIERQRVRSGTDILDEEGCENPEEEMGFREDEEDYGQRFEDGRIDIV